MYGSSYFLQSSCFIVLLSGDQQRDIVLGVRPRGVGPMVGGGPGDEEAMVFVLGKREVVLFPLPRGLQQFVAGHKPAYEE